MFNSRFIETDKLNNDPNDQFCIIFATQTLWLHVPNNDSTVSVYRNDVIPKRQQEVNISSMACVQVNDLDRRKNLTVSLL